jgi:chromosome segregation ATPase
MDPLKPLEEVVAPVALPLKIVNAVKNSKVTQFALTLLIGVAIGAVFYPTKTLTETLSKKYEQQISVLNTQHQTELATQKASYESQLAISNQTISTQTSKITSLQSSVSDLKSKQHIVYYKIVHPDGTVEERQTTDTSSDDQSTVVTKVQQEYTAQLAAIQTKYETIHKTLMDQQKSTYDSQIATLNTTISSLQSSKTETVNAKHYGVEGGMLTNSTYYVHGNADVFGPVFVGIHGEAGNSNGIGAGLGLRF